MLFIFDRGRTSIKLTVKAESVDEAKAKISAYLIEHVDNESSVDCGFLVGTHHWISTLDYDGWFAGEFKSTVISDEVHISYS